MGKQRGASIATVLMVMSVLMILALALATQGTFHLRLSTSQADSARANDLAESALALTIDELSDDQQFGTGNTSPSDTVRAQFRGAGPEAFVTFHPDLATTLGQPVSVNNLENDASVTLADGRAIPPFSAYLVSKAQVNGSTRIVETILHVPKYRYAIATSGSLSSDGGLFVAAVKQSADLNGGLAAIPPQDLLPGHVAANGTDTMVLESSTLAERTTVTGDALAGGSVTLGPFSTVQGSVRQNAPPEDLPDLTISDYDNASFAGLTDITQPVLSNLISPLEPVAMEGPWRRQGDLDIINGLQLDGGYLYVDGDVRIRGGLEGKGAIFATGDLNVDGAAAFSTDNIQALVAGGRVDVRGGSNAGAKDSAFLTGVMFNKGNVSLSNVTLVGSAVNNSPQSTTMEVTQTNLIHTPDVIDFSWDFGGADVSRLGVVGAGQPFHMGVQGQPFATRDHLDHYFDSQADAFDVPASVEETNVALYTPRMSASGLLGEWVFSEAGTFSNADDLAQFLLSHQPRLGIEARAVSTGNNLFQQLPPIPNPSLDDWRAYITPIFEDYQTRTYNRIYNSSILYERTRQESLKSGKFKLEPSQFIQFEDKIRVIWIDES